MSFGPQGKGKPKPPSLQGNVNSQLRKRELAGTPAYDRACDLPRLLSLWPHEISDRSQRGRLHALTCLRRALPAEQRRAASSRSYDPTRHLAHFCAHQTERAALAMIEKRPLSEVVVEPCGRSSQLMSGILVQRDLRNWVCVILGRRDVVDEDSVHTGPVVRQRKA